MDIVLSTVNQKRRQLAQFKSEKPRPQTQENILNLHSKSCTSLANELRAAIQTSNLVAY